MPVDITSEIHKLSGIVKRELVRKDCTSFAQCVVHCSLCNLPKIIEQGS